MKKNVIIPIITAALGILLGYIIFHGREEESPTEHEDHSSKENSIWTCSMHPQIRKNEPGDCPICGMELIPLNEAGGDNPLVLEMSEDAMHLAHIQTTIVGSSGIESTPFSVSGKIEANETTSASVVSHIPGRIEKLYVSFTGEKIYKGQKIAKIYSPLLITAQKELLEASKIKESQPKLFEAAVNKLKYWKITDKQIEEILSSGEVKENFIIYSDHTGVVQERKVSVGNHLQQGGVLFKIQNLNKLWVLFDVYEKDLDKVEIGNLIIFTTPSIPSEKFEAKVSFIDPSIDPNTRTAKVRVEISNHKDRLKPEMFVEGEIHSNFNSQMEITVPKSAVLWTGERSVVYVKVPELSIPSFEFREVLLGATVGDSYQIIDGLSPGEEVVTHGAFVIDASAQLNNQSSMMNRLVLGAEAEGYLPDFTEITPSKFKIQLESLTQTYLKLKEAFVNEDENMIKEHSESVLSKLNLIDMSLLNSEGHTYWMEQSKMIELNASHIKDASNLKKQREYFANLSEGILNSTKVFGTETKDFYEIYCSMANDKVGANWLSAEKEIRNPYFGEAMLGCGEVKNNINPEFRNEKPISSSGNPKTHNH